MDERRAVLVTGGTGTLGRAVVPALLEAGWPVRVLSRRSRLRGAPAAVDWCIGDLTTGEGLADAVEGAGTIVHLASDPRHPRSDPQAVTRLLAVARAAGTPHLLVISIVGVDRVPYRYYAAKYEVERLVEAGGVPWTILRATQFHDFVASVLQALSLGPVTLVPAGTRVQPVDVRDVAARIVELVEAGPSGRVPDLGGPESPDVVDLARALRAARNRPGRVWGVWLPGASAAAFRAGGHLSPEHADGTRTFSQHLLGAAR